MSHQPLEEKTEDNNAVVEDQLQRLLQEAGLESVPIDPMSLQALKEFVAEDSSFAQQPSTVESMEDEAKEAPTEQGKSSPLMTPPVYELTPTMKRYTSGLTSSSGGSFDDGSARTDDPVAGYVQVPGATHVEGVILAQLQRQTRLLLEMQRRIDELTATVDHLRGQSVGPETTSTNNYKSGAKTYTTYSAKARAASATQQPETHGWTPATPIQGDLQDQTAQPAARRIRNRGPQVQAQRGALPRPVRRDNNNVPRLGGGVRGIPNAIRNSRLAKILFLFLALRRRHVNEIDGGLIFKILFMMAILSARMSSTSNRFGDTEWSHKFAFVAVVVILGFLVQTGYMKYMYTFVVKENYPGRIWSGEEPEALLNPPPANRQNNNNNDNRQNNNQAAPPLPRGQMPPNHAHNPNNANANGWRNTFLGGMIPDGQLGGVAGAVQDVVLLFGSFLLSIFPMWNPEGNANRQVQQQQNQGQPQPPAGGQPAPGGLAAGPGEVRPPQDPARPVDDSDSDDED